MPNRTADLPKGIPRGYALMIANSANDPDHEMWLVTACNAGACGDTNDWLYYPDNYSGSPGYAIDAESLDLAFDRQHVTAGCADRFRAAQHSHRHTDIAGRRDTEQPAAEATATPSN